MTLTLSKLAVAAATASLGAAVVSGCGNDVPAGSVAKVGDETITKQEFDKWLKTAAAGQAQSGGAAAAVPDPPDYTNCVEAKSKQPAASKSKPSTAQLKKQCKQEYDQLKGEVMQFLIQAQWIQQEAEARGVKVSDAEVRKSLEDQKKQAFPTEKAYQRYLESSGMTEEDILFRVKLDQLQTKLTQKVTESEGKVSNADVKDYYEKNKKRFAQPERRDLNVVVSKTKAKAAKAKAVIRRGDSFKAVAKRYSIDNASKAQGGKLPAVAKGQQEKAFDEAIFSAKKGKITGPVKTQFGYYVFKVDKVTKASQQTLDEAKATIKQVLASQNQQKALDAFVKDFQRKWKEKTECREGYMTQSCKNAPKPTPTPTPPATQQAPGQQPAPAPTAQP